MFRKIVYALLIVLVINSAALAWDVRDTGDIPEGTVGESYNSTFGFYVIYSSSGNRFTGNVTWTVYSGSLPPGLEINSSGALEGTPTSAGTYTFTAKASFVNNGQSNEEVSSNKTIIIRARPEITTPSLPSAKWGTNYTAQLAVTPSEPVSWDISCEPYGFENIGLTYDKSTGRISGTPNTYGEFFIYATATNSRGITSDRKTLTLNIDPLAPSFRPNALNPSTARYDEEYSANILLYGTQDINYYVENEEVLNHYGLTLDLVSRDEQGTLLRLTSPALPTTGRNIQINLAATNPAVDTNSPVRKTYTLNIIGDAPDFTSASILEGRANVSTSNNNVTITASGDFTAMFDFTGAPPVSFTALDLPDGLYLQSSDEDGTTHAIISGIPYNGESIYRFTLAANNYMLGETENVRVTLNYYPVKEYVIKSFDVHYGVKDNVYNPVGRFYLADSNGVEYNGGKSITWTKTSGTNIPSGLSLNPSTGELTGTPQTSGTFNFGVSALIDGEVIPYESDMMSITIYEYPVISTASLPAGKWDTKYAAQLELSQGGSVSWDITSAPYYLEDIGLSYNKATGEITGTPVMYGTFTVWATAVNSVGLRSDTKTLNLTIDPAAPIFRTTSLKSNARYGSSYTSDILVYGTQNMNLYIENPEILGDYDLEFEEVSRDDRRILGRLTCSALPAAVKGLEINFAVTNPYTETLATPEPVRKTYTLNVTGNAPNFTGSSITEGMAKVNKVSTSNNTVTITASDDFTAAFDFTGAPRISFIASSLPEGLSFTSSDEGSNKVRATISGKPDNGEGIYNFTITANNYAAQSSDDVKVTLNYYPVKKYRIKSADLHNGVLDEDYNPIARFYLEGLDGQEYTGTKSITWSKVSGTNLPAGLSLNSSNGELTGRPTTTGTYNFRIQAMMEDEIIPYESETMRVTVYQHPVISTTSLPSAKWNSSYSAKLAVNKGGPVSWDAACSPRGFEEIGLEFNSSTGAITGTPISYGKFTVTVFAENAAGLRSDPKTFTLDITPAAPVFRTSSLKHSSAKYGEEYQAEVLIYGTQNINVEFDNDNITSAYDLSLNTVSRDDTQTLVRIYTRRLPAAAKDVKITLAATNPYTENLSNPKPVTKTYTLNITGDAPKFEECSILSGAATVTDTNNSTVNISSNGEFRAALDFSGSPRISFKAASLPDGMELTSTDIGNDTYRAIISGVPSKGENVYTITLTAQNLAAGTSTNVRIALNYYSAPVITTSKLSDATWGKTYKQSLSYKGGGDKSLIKWEIANGNLPDGLTFDDKGTITGTPTITGTTSLTFRVTGQGGSAQTDFDLTVKSVKPKFKTTRLENLTVGTDGSITIETEGPDVELALTGELPSGLTWTTGEAATNNTATITGTPLEANKKAIVAVTATNSAGTVKKSYKLVITGTAPKFVTPSTAITVNTITGEEVEIPISIEGTLPIDITSSKLPAGLTFNKGDDGASATITGTPTKEGKKVVTITANNKNTGKATVKITISTIAAPAITKASLKKGTVGSKFSDKFTATGTKPLTWTAENLPAGLTLRPDGTLTGTPLGFSASDTPFTFTVKVTNSAGSDEREFTLDIADAKPKIKAVSLPVGYVDTPYNNIKLESTAGTITWDVSGLPDGLELNGDTITGTPVTATKSQKITITATNGTGTQVVKKTKMTIKDVAPVIENSGNLGNMNVGDSANFDISLSSGTGSMTWTIAGKPSKGLTVSISGSDNSATLTAMATKAGMYSFKIQAKNKTGNDKKSFTITVTDNNSALPQNFETLAEIHEVPDEVASIPESVRDNDNLVVDPEIISIGTERTALSLGTNELEILSDDYEIAAVLPEIQVRESGLYELDVDIDSKVLTGATLFWFAFPQNAEPCDDDEIAEFYDVDGAEIETVPENHSVTISAWFREGVKYAPVIAVTKPE